MDNNNKRNSRQPFAENSFPRDRTGGIQWNQESHREHQREHTKSRTPGRDGEWNRNRSYQAKSREYSRNEDNRLFNEQAPSQSVQQTASFPPYNFNAADHTDVDNMMCYNALTMSVPWGVNQLDTMPMNSNPSAMPMSTGMETVPAPNSTVAPYAYMGMPAYNIYGVVGMGNYCQYGMMGAAENMFPPIKEIIQLTKSVLYPLNPNAPRPRTRGKPLGCKTVFVGGLPEKATEEILKEIFERCGTVETIRMSKKNFCHIRFSNEMFVDNAIYFSGYRIKIENKDEPSYTGRLHVDYARARDDQYDYDCKQRSLQRQARHQEQDYYRSVTPPVVVFSEQEASLLKEKLRNEETFSQAALILITWLERGECSKQNAGTFYSMIQSTNNNVRRLQVDKAKYEEQLNDAKKMLKKNLEGIIRQFTSIVKIYKVVSLQKVWDHFTKAQRKNIEMWRKQTEELRNAHVEEVINEREDEEMALSEDESGDAASDQRKSQLEEENHKLREENNSLRCQLETYQDIMMLKSDHEKEIKMKDSQIWTLRQALQNSKKELLSISQKFSKEEAYSKESRAFIKRRREEDEDDNDRGHNDDDDEEAAVNNDPSLLECEARVLGLTQTLQDDIEKLSSRSQKLSKEKAYLKELRTSRKRRRVDDNDRGHNEEAAANNSPSLLESEARLIGLISAFLHSHSSFPSFGANIDYICSCLHQIDSTIKTQDVEKLLQRFPSIFREDSTGNRASLGKKWHFIGFQV